MTSRATSTLRSCPPNRPCVTRVLRLLHICTKVPAPPPSASAGWSRQHRGTPSSRWSRGRPRARPRSRRLRVAPRSGLPRPRPSARRKSRSICPGRLASRPHVDLLGRLLGSGHVVLPLATRVALMEPLAPIRDVPGTSQHGRAVIRDVPTRRCRHARPHHSPVVYASACTRWPAPSAGFDRGRRRAPRRVGPSRPSPGVRATHPVREVGPSRPLRRGRGQRLGRRVTRRRRRSGDSRWAAVTRSLILRVRSSDAASPVPRPRSRPVPSRR